MSSFWAGPDQRPGSREQLHSPGPEVTVEINQFRRIQKTAEPNRVVFVFTTDDGKIFHGSGIGDAFGPRCFKGDIMGCGIMFPRDYILDGEGEG